MENKEAPRLKCGVCGKTNFTSASSLSYLPCHVHFSCGSHAGGTGCEICLCDGCDRPITKNSHLHLCGCVYHAECFPGLAPDFKGCLWCSAITLEQENSHGIQWLTDLPQKISRECQTALRPAYLSEEKLVRKQGMKGWNPEEFCRKYFYTATSWKTSRITLEKATKLGFTPIHFKNMRLQAREVIEIFANPATKVIMPNEALLSLYEDLELLTYCQALGETSIFRLKKPVGGFPKALVACGVNRKVLMELFLRSEERILLTEFADLTDWKEAFPQFTELYKLNEKRAELAKERNHLLKLSAIPTFNPFSPKEPHRDTQKKSSTAAKKQNTSLRNPLSQSPSSSPAMTRTFISPPPVPNPAPQSIGARFSLSTSPVHLFSPGK